MRALLLCNPRASGVSTVLRDAIARSLSAELKLDVDTTARRGHASTLAARAVYEGYEVVIALGGDGTVNEVVQGLACTDVRLAIIPAGAANVWARALGVPPDPPSATAVLLRRLADRQDRRVSLGLANGRWFTFAAGFGYDAAVVRAVDAHPLLKRHARQAAFVGCGLLTQLDARVCRAQVRVTVHRPDGGRQVVPGFRAAVACNADPYTFLGRWPARLCPRADVAGDLDLTALRSVALPRVLRVVGAALSGPFVPSLPGVHSWHDQPGFTLTSPVPLPVHVDGEALADARSVDLRSIRGALNVVA